MRRWNEDPWQLGSDRAVLTPLTSAVLSTLSANDTQLHHDWVGVVGAVVGRDDAVIRAGVHSVLSAAGGHDAFLRRLQLDAVPIQTAMLLLRIYHCIQTVGLSSALQMWAPSWPSVCNTSVVGVHATAALVMAWLLVTRATAGSGKESESGELVALGMQKVEVGGDGCGVEYD